MISINSIYKSYNDLNVMQGLCLDINSGDRVAIIGPSGCGKSTLLRLLMGFEPVDSGNIHVEGQDITTMSENELIEYRRTCGLLFQSAALFDFLSVFDNVAFSFHESEDPLPHTQIKSAVMTALDLVGMADFAESMPAQLSGGQRKRIGLARAIVTKPSVMMYDEPTTGLDPLLSTKIEDLIIKLGQDLNMTSIIVTHQISTILRTPDRIHFFQNGHLSEPETPDSIQQSANPVLRTFINAGIES